METIPSLFAQAVTAFSSRPALLEPGDGKQMTTLTYQQLQERVHTFAGYLQQQQLARGERIMIWSASRINWLIAYLGALLVGLVVVPLDVNSKEDFLQRIAEITETKFLITTRKQYQILQQSSLQLIDIDSLPEGNFERERLPEIGENDLAELVFTSGTTGQPKGVMLAQRNIVTNAVSAVEVVKIGPNDRALSILPLSHMFEMTIEIALLYCGSSIVYARTLAPDTLLRLLAEQGASCMVLVPQALQLFLNGIEREVRRQKKVKQWELLQRIAPLLPFGMRKYLFGAIHQRFGGHFRLFVSGGAYLQPDLGRRWETMGFRVLQGYGATECAPIISATPFDDRRHRLESVGKPIPGVQVRIADDQEILVHGPNVALGYWKNPDATAAAFKDDWYYTGDLGYFDDEHYLYIKGRKKNLIVLANGMNVYPEDVENVLSRHDAVKEAVIIGLAEEKQEPQVHAILLLTDSDQARTVVQQANKQLASHQQIKGFTIWPEDDFPRTHTLKVKRQDVLTRLPELRTKGK